MVKNFIKQMVKFDPKNGKIWPKMVESLIKFDLFFGGGREVNPTVNFHKIPFFLEGSFP